MPTLEMLLQQEWVRTLLAWVVLLLVAWLAGRVVRFALRRALAAASLRATWRWDQAHKDAQSDIFDHLITILPEFGLALFQQPTGSDLRTGLLAHGAQARWA